MRENIIQAEDQDTTARHLTDLINKYGSHGWIDHAIEVMGPSIFYQLGQIADVLEMFQKFALP